MTDILSISQLIGHIAILLREDETLADVTVAGEVSNATLAKSGHFYFTLKDAGAAIGCVMWRHSLRGLFDIPGEGQRVIAHGRVDLYAPRGQLQLVVDSLHPEGGVGELYRRFEEIKARLQAEGLFDPARKRPLPVLPRRIGVITSATGAALRDILHVLAARWPLADVLIAPSLVQGAQAPAALQAALYALWQVKDVDVILIGRGGGSIEDLWAFNDEGLARLAAQSPVPVVSGVGHETDFTILDFVADVRAATPSAAAALLTPDQAAARQEIETAALSLHHLAGQRIERRRLLVERAQHILRRHSPRYRIDQQRQLLDDLDRRLHRSLHAQLERRLLHLQGAEQRLAGVNPLAVLARGYAIVQGEGGQMIRSVAQVGPGQALRVRVSDGAFPVSVSTPPLPASLP